MAQYLGPREQVKARMNPAAKKRLLDQAGYYGFGGTGQYLEWIVDHVAAGDLPAALDELEARAHTTGAQLELTA